MSFYSGVKKLFSPLCRKLFRIKITGAENFPKEGGAIVSSNHTSMLDVVALAASLDRLLNYMAKKELFKFKPLGWFLKKLGAFPVDRGGADVKAIRTTIALVEKGELVNIFPQGTRHKKKDPSKTPIKAGVGMIAYHVKCPIIPIFIKAKNNHLHMFGKNEIIIGKPITFDELNFESGGMKEYTRASRTVFSRICALGGYDFPIDAPEEVKRGKQG